MTRRGGSWLALAALASACTTPPPPLAAADVVPQIEHELVHVRDEQSSPQRLHIRVHALAQPVDGPAVELAAAVITSESGLPFRGASALPPGTRWLTGDAAVAWRQQRELLDATAARELGSAAAVVARGLVTIVRTAAGQLPDVHLQVETADADAPDADAPDADAPDADAAAVDVRLVRVAASGARDVLRLRDGLRPGDTAVLFVPANVGRVAGHALVLRHDVAPPPAPDVDAAFAGARGSAPVERAWPAAWRQAFAAIGEHDRRPALLGLARPLGCARAADVLLTADEPALIDVTQALHGVEPDAPDAAWQFERALWTALLPRLERDDFPAAMHAALVRHLGAVANDPTTLRLMLATATDGPAFAAALLDENREALGERDPVQRVRGHDWLVARDAAVAGYSPLASAAERRAALRRRPSRDAAGAR